MFRGGLVALTRDVRHLRSSYTSDKRRQITKPYSPGKMPDELILEVRRLSEQVSLSNQEILEEINKYYPEVTMGSIYRWVNYINYRMLEPTPNAKPYLPVKSSVSA